ncbi:MAG: glycosyltransferase [Deltaproteobacteria bacterium]|nr:glycosyltransferase [Deltaproteobacteria bacterium]
MLKRRKKKLTILFLIGSLELGGAEGQMAALIGRLVGRGVNCRLFVLESPGPLYDSLKGIDLEIHDGGYRRKSGLVKKVVMLFRAQFRVFRVLAKLRPDVIHAYLPLTNFMGALAGRLSGVPLVITSRRALGTHQDRYKGWRIFDILSFRLSHLVTVNSRAVGRDSLIRDLGDPLKVRIIYNGIDALPFESAGSERAPVRRALGILPGEKVVVSIANLIPYKGLADLIEAAATVRERMPEVKFLLIGEDRGIQKQLEEKAHRMGLSQQIVFLGQRLDVPELLAAGDLLALSSHEEGFSNVILEAMASGLPVVATDVGGNREAVMNGITGWLVPPRDPDAMADRILDLLSDKERAAAWGRQGRERVKEVFTIDGMVEAHMNLYRGVVSATSLFSGDGPTEGNGYVRHRGF